MCRMCDSKEFYEFLDLGFLPPADGILKKEELNEPEIFFPLKVAQCLSCGLTQLTYAVNPEILYNEKYSYESSITEIGKKHFFDMADSICRRFNFRNELAIDIGSNVGVLLEGFKRNGLKVLGIDAAPKIVEIANRRGIETWRAFFNSETAKKILEQKGKAKIITGTNVFAHIDDKKGLMDGVNLLLEDDGIFVIEAPYFVDLVENLEYDTIYLDHLEYLSVKPLVNFFEKNGMDVFDVERYEIHGKSIRVFVGRKNSRRVSENVGKLLKLEEDREIYRKEFLDNFSKKINEHRKEFLDLLIDLKKQGKKVIGISAPAKANTILNYCKIDSNIIDYMTEKSKLKPGHYTPGMHIPIIEEETALKEKVDYGIIFAWNFAKEIIENSIEFTRRGGKFIIPIPKPKIMGNEDNLFGVQIKKIGVDFMDERGMISDLLNKQINHVGLITTEVGAQRGPHYHKLSIQDSYILSGRFEVTLAPANNPKNSKKIILNSGEMITIPPLVIHGFKAMDRAIMIDMSQTRGETGYESDVVRISLEEMEQK
ncbi:methyltransferase domain-containing protein [Candidatus Pacearchaeota archaeon]|nr:methyltransferase domain-containing protein [Candidatus Pacearchaeota archaeon]